MKIYIIIMLVISLGYSCRNNVSEKGKLTQSLFTNEDKLSDSTISLNNFKDTINRNGLEYILSQAHKVKKIRNWKNNKIEGPVIEFTSNEKVKSIYNYKNNLLYGKAIEIDSVSSKISEYREYRTANGKVRLNQYISFKDGKLNSENSFFYICKVKKISEDSMRVSFFTFDSEATNMRIVLCSFDANYNVRNTTEQYAIYSSNKNHCEYQQLIEDTLSGFIDLYRATTVEEKKLYGTQNASKYIYFKIPVRFAKK